MPADQGGGPHFSGTRLDVTTANIDTLNLSDGGGLSSVVTTGTNQTITGVKNFSQGAKFGTAFIVAPPPTNTDDTSALAALIAANTLVQLQPGTYIASGLSVAVSRFGFIGCGDATTLQLKAASNTDLISVTGTGTVGFQLRSLILDGNKANQSGACNGITINTPYSSDDTWHVLEDVHINNAFTYGLQIIGDTREVHMRNVRAYNAGTDGFELGGGDHKWNGCVAGNPGRYGFHFSGSSGGQFHECKSFGTFNIAGTRGFMFEGTTTDNQLIGCWAQDSGYEGFVLSGSGVKDNQLVGCRATQNGRQAGGLAGFKLDGCVNNVLTGCTATDSQGVKTQAYGLQIINAATGNVITGGDLNGNATSPVDISGMTAYTNRIANVTGYNPRANNVATPAFPGNTVNQTNQLAVDVMAYIVNGVNAMTVRVDATVMFIIPASQTGSVVIPAGSVFQPAYAGGSPTWQWYGL